MISVAQAITKDAGKITANKLITYLHKNASGDLRIIERENLQAILREMQLGQTGIVDVKSVQTAKMRGIDTFIMGDVLNFTSKMTDNPSTSQVKVLVDEGDVRNPEFSDWLIMHETHYDLTNEKVSEMGKSVLKYYQSLEVEYFNQGEQQAIEKHIDAIFDEKSKGIATAISLKSAELIESLIQGR